jgi:RNA polymerase sigma-70 factor (sigma-E family)
MTMAAGTADVLRWSGGAFAVGTTSRREASVRSRATGRPGGSPDEVRLGARNEAPARRPGTPVADDPTTWDADTAVTMLYGSHWAPLVRLATLLTRDASVAEELVQDAFVALHRRWDALADPGAAHGYLRTSVVNASRSALRHRGVEERYRQPAPPEPAGPEERAVRSSEDARVMAALRTLPRRQQEVLVLRYYSDLSEFDIAQTLGLSRGAVKSHAHRGLAALRAALERLGEVPE